MFIFIILCYIKPHVLYYVGISNCCYWKHAEQIVLLLYKCKGTEQGATIMFLSTFCKLTNKI